MLETLYLSASAWYGAPNPIIRLKNFVRCQKQIVNVLLFFHAITNMKNNCSLPTTQSQENLKAV